MQPMTWPAHDATAPRPYLHLVPSTPEATARPARRWKVIATHAGRALIASLLIDGATTIATSDGTTQIVVAAIGGAAVVIAAFVAAWYRGSRNAEGSSRGETRRLRRERDEARAERDEVRDLNETLLRHLLDRDAKDAP